jgi:hypothetical protein
MAPVALTRRGVVILAASGLIQLAVAALPDTMGDLLEYRLWTRALAQEGLAAAYWPPPTPLESAQFHPPVDYPPVLPYVLWCVGRVLHAVSPHALAGGDRILDFLIRGPFCLSSLLLALLVHAEARRLAPGLSDLALGLVALNPAVIFDTAYWGQADALYALLLAAALVAMVRGQPEWSCVLMALAALTKPLAYPFALLVAVVILKRFGVRRTLRCAAAGALAVGVVLLPFGWIGRLTDGLRAIVSQLDAMPFVSVNAHNVWWLVERGTPWLDASVRPLGLLSWKAVSLVAFGAFYLVVVVRLWRSSDARALYVAAASTALGFFALATHMHENHLFAALPLLALAGIGAKRVRFVFVAVSVTLLVNMSLHDPYLTHVFRPMVPGPHILLPPELEPQEQLGARLAALGYPWIVDQMRGETSLVGHLATLANAQANVLIFVLWLGWAFSRRGLEHVAADAEGWRSSGLWIAIAGAFVVVSGLPFVDHALRFPREHLFLLRFPEAQVETRVANGVSVSTFAIEDDKRTVLLMRAPAKVRYRLRPAGTSILRFGAAVRPDAWSSAGVRFEVAVEEGSLKQTVFARSVDLTRTASDRRWLDAAVDLSEFSGRDVTLVFAVTETTAGSAPIWAGFSDPTIVSR